MATSTDSCHAGRGPAFAFAWIKQSLNFHSAPFSQKLAWRLEAVGYGLISGLLRLLPVDTASDLGAWLVERLGPLTGVDKTVHRNLRLAFPELSEAERDRIRRAQWADFYQVHHQRYPAFRNSLDI